MQFSLLLLQLLLSSASLLCFNMAAATQEDAKAAELPEVVAPVGRIRGSVMRSRLGRRIFAFRGVRYAEPPVGQRRFAQAVPVVPWQDVFDATEEGPSCPHPRGVLQSEDCLRLNVYSTELPSDKSSDIASSKRPVIVFFHAGGYYSNSGQSLVEGPQYFMDQDIVLVVVNYRLGSLGFLSTGDSLAPGNLGLKDQVESLRWVRRNIASFGGDPDCVTISGYSAGGWSVTLHLVSPMTRGLFHRAIVMSGSAIYQSPLPNHQKHLATKQAELVGCPTDSTGSMLLCLNTKNATEISDTLPEFFDWRKEPILIWLPVVEPEIPGVERFLTAQPADLIREGKFHKVPVIAGITKDEFGGRLVPIIEEARKGNFSVFDDLNTNWEKIAPIICLYERDTPRSREISEALRQFYFKGQPIGLDNADGLAHLYADGVIGFATNRFAKLMARASDAPVYYYEFTYQGRYSHHVWSNTNKPYGGPTSVGALLVGGFGGHPSVVHHDDLLYLFYVSFFPYFEENAPENTMVERLTAMWANFAKTGEPIPGNNEKFSNVTWTPFTAENNAYMEIGDKLEMKTNLYGERMNEWERIFPLAPLARTEEH